MSKQIQQDQEQEQKQQEEEEIEAIQQNDFKELYVDQDQFMRQINQLNEQAVLKIKLQKYQEAMKLFLKLEQMLIYAKSCGKQIDKDLIIVISYNQACCYQSQWILDKCTKYLNGVIYNLDEDIKEKDINKNKQISDSTLVKKKTFLARASLQETALLSQLGKHKQALQSARRAADSMREVFKLASQFCLDWLNKNGSLENINNSCLNNKSKQNNNKFQMKDEVEFSKLVINFGKDILLDMLKYQDLDNMSNDEQLILREAKKQLYFWKNNPSNNEKHIRKELKLSNKMEDYRSILGVQNVQEWIQSFNISFIMNMTPLIHNEFTQQGEMLYEISKRLLFEKIIQLSISYFTIATELRFIELEKAKQLKIKELNTDEFKLSELYHLKAIEIACKYITCTSQYINHLITTYHKHYNSNLDTIQEESINSIVSDINYKELNLQKLKFIQIQTQRDNQLLFQNINEQNLNDTSSTTGILTNSFNGLQSLKSYRKISDNLKTQPNNFNQIIRSKRILQIPSDFNSKQKFQFFNASTNNSCEKVNEKILKMQEGLPVQFQTYKSAKLSLNHLLKQTTLVQKNNNGLQKSFLLDRQNFIKNHTPKGGRSPQLSPCKSQVKFTPLTSILQNKTIHKQEIESQFSMKLETLQQLLSEKSQNNQKRK